MNLLTASLLCECFSWRWRCPSRRWPCRRLWGRWRLRMRCRGRLRGPRGTEKATWWSGPRLNTFRAIRMTGLNHIGWAIHNKVMWKKVAVPSDKKGSYSVSPWEMLTHTIWMPLLNTLLNLVPERWQWQSWGRSWHARSRWACWWSGHNHQEIFWWVSLSESGRHFCFYHSKIMPLAQYSMTDNSVASVSANHCFMTLFHFFNGHPTWWSIMIKIINCSLYE